MGRLRKSEQERIFVEGELEHMGAGEMPDGGKNGK